MKALPLLSPSSIFRFGRAVISQASVNGSALVGEWQSGFELTPQYPQFKLRLTLAKPPVAIMPMSYDEQIKKVFHKATPADRSSGMRKCGEQHQTAGRKEVHL